MTCCLLEKAEREWGAPPSRAIRTPRIFPRIFCAFLRDSETPIFQALNVEEKSAENLRKNGRKNLRTKNLRKNGRTNLRTKKWAQKTSMNIPFVWKMEARKKKNTKKICTKLAQNPSPQNRRFSQRTAGTRSPLRFFPLSAALLLRRASQGVQRDRARNSPFPPENALQTYCVPGWKARLIARHVWKIQETTRETRKSRLQEVIKVQ